MFRNHILVALRSLRRRWGYALINVVGLAVGVAACLLILHYAQDEWAFDRFHAKGDRTYRLVSEGEYPAVGWPYGRLLEAEFPEVEQVIYLRTWPNLPILHEGERHFERLQYAEPAFFEVFDFPLIEGDAAMALEGPYSIVLSETLAAKLFGDEPALGRSLRLGDNFDIAVSGVARVPRQSHIQFDGMLSMATLRDLMGPSNFDEQMETGWFNMNMVNYVVLRPGTDADAFAARIRDLPTERVGEQLSAMGATLHLGLEPVPEIYLRSELPAITGPSGSLSTVCVLTAVALFILLLAGVNFVNLSTARSMERAREVGVRKAIGSSRAALVRQFLAESTVTGLAAVLLGAALAWLALPYFAELADRSYVVADLFTPSLVLSLVGLVLLVGVLAGFYPAVVLSRFRPVEVLRGRFAVGRQGVRLRQGLVVMQFGVSSVLLIGTLVVLHQLHFMQSQHPGFDRDQVLIIDARNAPAAGRSALKEVLESHSAVQRVAAAYAVPGEAGWQGQMSFPESLPDGQSVSLEYIPVDHDYVATLGLEIVAGRDFHRDYATDEESAVIINEAAVRVAGWTSPADAVGKRFTSPGSGKPNGVVIGVVRDHHHHGLQEPIGPIMYGINPWATGLLAVRMDVSSAASVIRFIEDSWQAQLAEYPYGHAFLDESFARQYGEERRLSRILGTFAVLAVLIACLGLFGLAAFSAQQRRREMGVRKALGATTAGLVALMSREFVLLVAVAFVLAAPVTYWATNSWLEEFAYRISVGPFVFLVAGLAALTIALLAVGYHAVRAARADPVDAIRAE